MDSYSFNGSYLKQFAECDRSTVTGFFCASFREWAEGVPSIEDLLRSVCGRVLRAYREDNSRAGLLETVYHSLSRPDAEHFAQFIIRREQLPADVRSRLKAKQAAQFREEYMAKQPPTEKQLAYLRRLGCSRAPADRLEAAQLIDELTRRRAA
jgi:uncharacterized protein (DUF2336 family)